MIRVASIPASHPYVRAVTDPARVVLLPDPRPPRATEPGQWWPPRWLEPDYLLSRIGEIEVMHLHFGFDDTPVEVLAAVCATLAMHRVPLVLTVHDLHNPHFASSAVHREQLALLVSEASAVITLTAGAARAIDRWWHRAPVVLPHPHLLPLDDVGAPRDRRDHPVVAIHAKRLRANIDPWPLLAALEPIAGRASLRIDFDHGVLDAPRAPDALSNQLAQYISRGIDVRVHPPFTDAELLGYLREIDVLVLPYRFGTHSGWVELCHDAGVRAVVPDCGHFHEQHPVRTFGFDRSGLDCPSLLAAVADAMSDEHAGGEDLLRRRARAEQRRQVQRAHVSIYRRAIDEAAA